MSVLRTLKLRGPDPTPMIATALRTLLQTGSQSPLPGNKPASG